MQIVLNNNKALYVENGCYNSKCYNKNHVRVTWKFLGGGGVIKVPLGTEIPKGWGDANQKPSVGGVWIFSGTTHSRNIFCVHGFLCLSVRFSNKADKKLWLEQNSFEAVRPL